MSDNAEKHIQLNVSLRSGGTRRQGFGTLAIISHNATGWTERSRTYDDDDGVAADWDSDSPEARAAAAVFSQDPKPEQIKILNSTVSVTQKYLLHAASVQNSKAYSLLVKGQGFEDTTLTTTSASVATREAIDNALLALLNGVTDKNFTATFLPLVVPNTSFTADASTNALHAVAHGLHTGDGPVQLTGGDLPLNALAATDYYAIVVDDDHWKLATSRADAFTGTFLDLADAGTGAMSYDDTADTTSPYGGVVVTGNAAGDWFSIEVASTILMSVAQTHTVSGLGDDLSEILLEDDEFFCLIALYPSTDYCLDVSEWAEANGRVFVLDVNETEALNTTEGSGTDTLKQLFELGRKNTMYCYHHAPNEFLSAAIMGRWLPTTPGKAIVKFKTLSGITRNIMNPTQRNNLEARKANSYTRDGGRNMFWDGAIASSENIWFDVTRNLMWLADEIVSRAFETLATPDEVPYTREGIQTVVGSIEASFELGIQNQVLSPDFASTVTGPDIADVDTDDKSSRIVRNVHASTQLGGAIQKAIIDLNVTF